MPVDRAGVVKIAELAKLEFSDRELDAFTPQFQSILDYVEQLKAVDVEGVEPTSHASIGDSAAMRVARNDQVRASLPVEEALSNAPDPGGDHFRVPKVI